LAGNAVQTVPLLELPEAEMEEEVDVEAIKEEIDADV
jgi:hypothetical protein